MVMETEIQEITLYSGAINYNVIPRTYSLTVGNIGDYVAPESVRWLLDAEERLNEKINNV